MWYSATRVGILEIDMDHDNVDTMLRLYFSGQAPENCLEIIVSGLIRHFPHEEEVIVRMGLKFPSEHRAEHERLTQALERMIGDWRAGRLDGNKLAEDIKEILLLHVMEYDVKLADLKK